MQIAGMTDKGINFKSLGSVGISMRTLKKAQKTLPFIFEKKLTKINIFAISQFLKINFKMSQLMRIL